MDIDLLQSIHRQKRFISLINSLGILKRPVLNRKNAYFYRNETGAKIGDILMSVIETCVINSANPWEYLVVIQKYQQDVRTNPDLWTPWAYENRLKELQPPALQEALQQ